MCILSSVDARYSQNILTIKNIKIKVYKIDLDSGVKGVDGVIRTRNDIELYYINWFYDDINQRLQQLLDEMNGGTTFALPEFILLTEKIKKNLKTLLISSPFSHLRLIRKWNQVMSIWKNDPQINPHIKEFCETLFKKFNYKGFRRGNLNRLAVMLNVKTCLYCNQQYTLSFGTFETDPALLNLGKSTAFLQFDHFFDKSTYPFLSMCLYNLIPSCGICNQKKSKSGYDISLHPYISGLSEKIRFLIKDTNAMTNPHFKNNDHLNIEIDTGGDPNVSAIVGDLNLELRYSRHLDIVRELECAKYVERYYSDLEDWLASRMHIEGSCDYSRRSALQRYLRGYRDECEINDEPLTKFRRDIANQL